MKKKNIIKIINMILIFIMIPISIIRGTNYLINGEALRSFSGLSILLTLSLPLILNKTKYNFNDIDKLFYYSFIFVAHFLGSVIGFYKYISWFDLFAHFISGILTFYIAYYILEKNKVKIDNPFILILYFLGFISLVAISWEIVEFSGDILFNSNIQHHLDTGVKDTMEDMIIALVGGILSIITYFSLNRKVSLKEKFTDKHHKNTKN